MVDAALPDPYAPEWRADPYAAYALLRQAAPAHWSSSYETWIVTSFDGVSTGLRDDRLSSDARNAHSSRHAMHGDNALFAIAVENVMLFMDPPLHTRLRRLVATAFRDAAGRRLGPIVASAARAAVDALEPGTTIDFVASLSAPITVEVIGDIVGIPREDQQMLADWGSDLARTIEPAVTQDDAHQAAASGLAFISYLGELIAAREVAPTADFVSCLLRPADDGERLSRSEVIFTCILIYLAGHETIANFLGLAIHQLIKHPDQLWLLRQGDVSFGAAVEELLRYDGPTQLTSRTAVAGLVIEGESIDPGSRVELLLGAANRDPRRFDGPDRLRLDRTDGGHVAFGFGLHACLGAAIARIEAVETLRTFLDRCPQPELADEPEWKPSATLRGPRSLLIHVA